MLWAVMTAFMAGFVACSILLVAVLCIAAKLVNVEDLM